MAKINRNDLDYFFSSNLHVPSRTLYIGGDISETMTENVIKSLKILDEASSETISLIMNSPGGELINSFAIYDFIRNCRSYVVITVYGYAMSGGSLILQAADERILSENSSFMIHFGSDGYAGEHTTFLKTAEESKRLRSIMMDIYLEKIHEVNPEYKRSTLRKLLETDSYFSAKDVVELGLADKIIGKGR